MTAAQFINHVERSAEWVRQKDQDKFFKQVRSVAGEMVPELARRFNQVKKKCGLRDANLELTRFNDLADRLQKSVTSGIIRARDFWRKDLNLAATDDDINAFCDAKARQCDRLINDFPGVCLSAVLLNLIESYGVTLGSGEREKIEVLERPMLERLKSEKWWRRKIKPLAFRTCEQIFRELGHTRRNRGVYISGYTFRRFLSRERRNKNLLESLEATNEAGDVYTLKDLSDLGMSNHELRRGELMMRMRGFEEWSEQDSREWVPMFYTVTCPSKYHIYSGDIKNDNYEGSSPRDAQQYLSALWARTRAKAARSSVKYFGFRICEPHHDGCPHWHLLLFVEKSGLQRFSDIFRNESLRVDKDEPGAARRRFDECEILAKKGTAAGYIAKYVSKNIDGFAVGEDWEAQDLTVNTAARVRAWAACWGIRQFQQIGGPPVTVYRELRRLSRHPEALPSEGKTCGTPEQLALVLDAADAGNWCEFTEQMGGAVCPRAERPISLETHDRVGLNQYGEIVKHIYGVMTKWFVFPLRTRFHTWTVTLKQVAAIGARMVRACAGRTDAHEDLYSHLYPVDFFGGATAPPLSSLDLCQ